MSQQQTNGQRSPEMTPEMMRNTQELAAAAAVRAKEMLQHRLSSIDAGVPQIPARIGDFQKAPEIPPKRLSLKGRDRNDNDKSQSQQQHPVPIPQRNQVPIKAPPIPMKPSSVQNSPLMQPKFKDKLPNSPLMKPSPPLAANQFIPKMTPNFSTSSQMNTKSDVSNLKNSPLRTKISSNKTISPTEELGSEDALRGIESGLRNMERAMQEQMNLRSLDSSKNQQHQQQQQQQHQQQQQQSNRSYNPNGKNIRSIGGSITCLDAAQNMRGLENMRLKFDQQYNSQTMRGMERGISMDQMRLENFHGTLRSMESNPNIRTSELQMKGIGVENTTVRPMEHNFRSLDRNIPLEMQYSRQRSQDIEFMRELGRNAGAILSRQSGLSKEDVRMRRRSSHDETQFSQGNTGNHHLNSLYFVYV